VADAKKRLQAMNMPVPTPTPEAIAQNKKEIESRGHEGMYGKLMENFRHSPDTTEAVKVGEPTLVDPKQASAPDFVRDAATSLINSVTGGVANPPGQAANAGAVPTGTSVGAPSDNSAGAEILPTPSAGGGTATPAATQPPPSPLQPASGAPAASDANSAASDFKNDLAPAAGNSATPAGTSSPPSTAPAGDASTPTSTSSATAPAASSATTSGSTASAQTAAPAADTATESTSKKKKKHLWPF